MKNQKMIMMILAVSLYLSCCTMRKQDNIVNEKSFAEMCQISQKIKLPFCLVLYDSTQVASQEYIKKLYQNSQNMKQGLFDLIDITSNESSWYGKLLSPQILPLTCVFTASGELIDLIPGSSQESLLYTKEALTNQKVNRDFHYNQQYGDNKKNIVSDINNIFHLKFKVDNKENVELELDTLLTRAYYPYTLFLKLKNQLQFKDTIAARNTARELLKFDSPRDLVDYYDEFMFAQQVIDPTFSIENGPYIEINPTEIKLTDCKRNKLVPIVINIKNKGQRPLKISDVLMSCTCFKLIGEKKYLILPQQTETLSIEFTPDDAGEIFREVYIASNSVNSPMCHIAINASVK
jgi:hypothetical protein